MQCRSAIFVLMPQNETFNTSRHHCQHLALWMNFNIFIAKSSICWPKAFFSGACKGTLQLNKQAWKWLFYKHLNDIKCIFVLINNNNYKKKNKIIMVIKNCVLTLLLQFYFFCQHYFRWQQILIFSLWAYIDINVGTMGTCILELS